MATVTLTFTAETYGDLIATLRGEADSWSSSLAEMEADPESIELKPETFDTFDGHAYGGEIASPVTEATVGHWTVTE